MRPLHRLSRHILLPLFLPFPSYTFSAQADVRCTDSRVHLLILFSDPAPVVIDLKHNAAAVRAMSSADKVTRYQQNPAPNWGPAKAAVQGAGPPAKKMALLVVDTDTEDATSMP